MDAFRSYILSVISASMICGIIRGLSQTASAKKMIRLMCSLFLCAVMIRPLIHLDIGNILQWELPAMQEALEASNEGERLTREQMASVICSQTQAYIANKAEALSAELTVCVEVSTDDPPLPEAVTLRGRISPNAKACLQNMIAEDLNIPKERQIWISDG